tara:strand:+ start:123 stop:1814 length:1692 start_codon:yes stop_codon:yes gene_type:complete
MIKFTFALLNSRQRLNFFLLLIFAVIVACLELLGIFSIFPFLTVISDPEIIKNNEYLFAFYNFFEFKNNNSFIQFLGISVIFLFLIRGIFAISLTALKMIFTRYFHRDLSFRLYKHYLDLEYLEFKKKKTASASEILVNETLYVSNSISDLITFITELILIFLIFSTLMIIDWQITLFSLAMLLFLGLFTIPITRSLTKIGIKRAEKQLNIYNIVTESFNVFKGIKILSAKEFFQNKFIIQLKEFAKNQINYGILGEVPKYFIEITAVIFIMTLILILNSDGSSSSSWVPIISTLALSFYRLLPSINRLISAYNQLKYNKRASNLILEELRGETENLASEKISFKRKVEFKNISVSFDTSKILKKVNLSIRKGEKIALIGPSGSGKTTFLDIFMGLVRPDDGIIEIDGQYLNKKTIKDWRSKIGYLPQENYLINGTVAENISFGREINTTKISESIKSSNLNSDPYFNISQNKKIGELGNTLSGGQKQRLMIARLAYGNPEILILDEPTSALDLENEEKIMSEVFKSFKEKTIIVVSHRDEAIKGCDRTIKIENGQIEEVQSN